jgi:NitT/TauT family transport system substrate-binding protein
MRKNILVGAVLSVAALVGLGGAASSAPFKLITTDLTAQLVPNSVMDMAADLGYFAKEGVEVELVRVQQTPSAVAALQAGEGDMANISVDAALQLVARDQMKLKAILSPNKALPYVIAAKDSIATIADLAGKNFGIGRVGSLDHSLSTAVMRTKGVDPEKVNFVAAGQPNERGIALASGQIDATTMSIGVWLSLPDKTGLKILVGQEEYYAAAPVLNKVNVVTDAVLAAKRDQVAAVTRALIKASRDFAAHPELWVEGMVKARPEVARETLEQLGKSFVASWSVNGGLNKDEIAKTVDWTYTGPDFKELRKVTLDEWVDLSVIADVLKTEGVAPEYDQPGF